MTPERPDRSEIPQPVVDYIAALEAEIARLQSRPEPKRAAAPAAEPSEPPTTLQLISATARGLAKRTPRHL